MKRAFAACILAALAAISLDTVSSVSTASAASTPAPKGVKNPPPKAVKADACATITNKWAHGRCEDYHHSAPGDEYFGRLKLSYLGINNTFHDEAIRSGAYTLDQGVIAKITFADDALRAWSSKYPGDPQLARSYYLAIEAFTRVYTQPAQNKAWQYMNLLIKRFPTSYFGKLEKKQLQIGFTEHYFALALPCPTPLPTSDVNAKSPKNTPTNSPSPEPLPTDTPTPKPGQPKIQIITPDCVPATPEPTEAPLASPSPAPSPTTTEVPSSIPVPISSPTPSP